MTQDITRSFSNSLEVILADILQRGVMFKIEAGRLRYQAPRGALADQEIAWLKGSRGRVLELLAATGKPDTEGDLQWQTFELAPLAFSQLAHWQNWRLCQRSSIRQIVSAARIVGPLSTDTLKSSFTSVASRHGALRTRVVTIGGVPMQRVDPAVSPPLQICEMCSTSRPAAVAIQEAIEALILEPVDVSIGPLWKLRLLKLQPDEHVLIIAMEHMISDASSLIVLLREALTEYACAESATRAPTTPGVSMQFADFALQQRHSTASWVEKHASHWNRLWECGRTRFPSERRCGPPRGWGTVPLRIGSELKVRLQAWCRSRGITLPMGMFTAYVALVLKWCATTRMVIRYVTDGRSNQKLESAIGFYASVLYLRIEVSGTDTFGDLVSQLVREYCSAHEHDDQFYWAAQADRPAFTKNTCFNWIPRSSQNASSTQVMAGLPLEYIHVPFHHPIVQRLDSDDEPFLVLEDLEEEVAGDVYFSRELHTEGTMMAFVKNLQITTEQMVTFADRPMSERLKLHTER